MPTLDQERALLAHEHVVDIQKLGNAQAKKYASIVHSMPALLRSAGLSQALHFVASRSDETQRELVGHLAAQLRRVDAGIGDPDTLLDRVRRAELPHYLRLTHEAIACADWYRRMVQAVLKIEAGESNGD